MNIDLENKLMKCTSIKEFITMYFGLNKKEQLSVLSDSLLIKKDKCFYRARKNDYKTDFSNPKEWEMAPSECVKQGRFNEDKKPVLYVASDEYLCCREIGLKDGDEYYIAKYICVKDFNVGTLFCENNKANTILNYLAMSIKQDNLTDSEKNMMLKYNVGKKAPTANDIYYDNLSPLYLNNYVKNLYEITNKIGRLILSKNPNGIRYASSYEPLELSGCKDVITFNGEEHGNYVLTKQGIENIKFLSYEKKKYKQGKDLSLMIEVFSQEKNKYE